MYFQFISKAFDSKFCDLILSKIQESDFEKASVNVYGQQQNLEKIRNNYRYEFDSLEISLEIKETLSKKANFPLLLDHKEYQLPSEHFRVYLYQPGQYFKPHKDGHVIEGHEESKITCLIYLNDTDGGETVLMPNGFGDKSSHIKIKPEKGSVLLFEHKIWHEGLPVNSGQKYVLRTNLIYK